MVTHPYKNLQILPFICNFEFLGILLTILLLKESLTINEVVDTNKCINVGATKIKVSNVFTHRR